MTDPPLDEPDPNEVAAVIADALAEWIGNSDIASFTRYESELMRVEGMAHVAGAMFKLEVSETNGEAL
jgi:hypothetical protein